MGDILLTTGLTCVFLLAVGAYILLLLALSKIPGGWGPPAFMIVSVLWIIIYKAVSTGGLS